jgi:Hemerythrin HHE cation binding domain
MNARELSKTDHQAVKETIRGSKRSRCAAGKGGIYDDIKTELETHARNEETIYPAVERYEELKDVVRESIEKHKKIKDAAQRDLKSNKEEFESQLKALWKRLSITPRRKRKAKCFQRFANSSMSKILTN